MVLTRRARGGPTHDPDHSSGNSSVQQQVSPLFAEVAVDVTDETYMESSMEDAHQSGHDSSSVGPVGEEEGGDISLSVLLPQQDVLDEEAVFMQSLVRHIA